VYLPRLSINLYIFLFRTLFKKKKLFIFVTHRLEYIRVKSSNELGALATISCVFVWLNFDSMIIENHSRKNPVAFRFSTVDCLSIRNGQQKTRRNDQYVPWGLALTTNSCLFYCYFTIVLLVFFSNTVLCVLTLLLHIDMSKFHCVRLEKKKKYL